MASLTQWSMSFSKLWEIAKERKACCTAAHGVTKRGDDLVTEQQYLKMAKRVDLTMVTIL